MLDGVLGPVDGFGQDEACDERDEGSEVSLRLLAAQGDALEALELADGLLDTGTPPVERSGEEGGPVLLVRLGRDDGNDAARACGLAVGLAGIAFVADGRAWIDVGAEPEQDGKVRRIGFLAAGQVEGDRMAVEVSLQMDLGREAAARTAERLAFLPPFAPAAEIWARTMVLSNICTRWAEADSEARWSKKISNTPALLNRSNRFHTLFH